MSIQPLKPSSSNHPDLNPWQEINKLAELLFAQSDIEAQLISLIKWIKQMFSCEANLWLAEPLSSQVRVALLPAELILLSSPNNLMQRAFDERRIIPDIKLEGNFNISSIALPLISRGTLMGIVQLDRASQAGFIQQDVELLSSLGSIAAIILDWQTQTTQYYKQKANIELLQSIVQITKSIASNLDLDSLTNSILTIIHQRFEFSRVRLYITQEREFRILSCMEISKQGLEPTRPYSIESENSPVSWAVSQREMVIINDVDHESRFMADWFGAETKSELVIPLTTGNRFLGVLDLCHSVSSYFTPDTVNMFTMLAESITIGIRNARLYQAEQVQREVADRIQELIGPISADMTLEDVIEDLLAELEQDLDCDASAIWLLDEASNDLEPGQTPTILKFNGVKVSESVAVEKDQSATLRSIRIKSLLSAMDEDPAHIQGAYQWLDEISSSSRSLSQTTSSYIEPLGEILSFKGDYSAIGIPLNFEDHPIGAIVAVKHLPDYFGLKAYLIASAFSKYASIGIENTRLYSSTHDQLWISTVLQQVTEAAQSASSLPELLDNTVSMLADLAGANGCTIYLWDQSLEALIPQASYGYDAEQHDRINTWDMVSGSIDLVDQLVETQSPVVLSLQNVPDDIVNSVFPNYDLQTDLLLLFPMIEQDEMLGAVLVDFTHTSFGKNSSQKLWDDKYSLVQGIIGQVANAIQNLQRLRSQEEEAYISIALLQVAQAIVSLKQLDEILASIVRITPILVGIKRCIIYLWEKENKVLQLSQQYGFSKNELQIIGQTIRMTEFPLIETIMVRNQIAYYQLDPSCSPADWSEIEPEDLHLIEGALADNDEQITLNLDDKLLRNKSRLLIGFPLAVINDVLGVMLIEEEEPRKGAPSYHIREKRIEIVNGITQQAAIAIKNELLQQEARESERMERELQLAREIQATFLPDHIPELPGWDMDARWQPAREVGGDFYDILQLDEDRIGFVIADVADKGMPAAMFMTLIRTLIRAAASDNDSPAEVLKQVNELLIPDSKHGMFVTVFYAVIALDSGKVTYANAGHNPPVIKSSQSDQLLELTRTSIALGLFENIEVDEQEVVLERGDWLFFYTDGVTEAFSRSDEMFGVKRLYEILLDNHYQYCKEILDAIESAVYNFIEGTNLSDDVTLAAIYRINR